MANLLSTVVNGYLASKLFIPGFDGSGWKIWEWVKGRYKLEVDDLTVRGTMTVFELIISKIRALMGAMAITQANGKVKGIREDASYYYLEIEDEMSFVEHDIVRCQTFTKNNMHGYWVEISEILGNEIKVSKDEFARDGEGRIADPPREGDELVQFGNSSKDAKYAGRHSAIYLSADETGQPCIDVLQGIYAKSFDGYLKLRAGCLDGINDADFPGGVKDFGIYCANGYFKGDIAGAGGYMLRSDGSGYLGGGAISWRWNAVQKKYVVTMGSDVVLQWENLSEETRRNLKGKDGRDGINGRHGAKGDPGRDADIVFPWLEDWQSDGTTIGGEFVASPKMFSGTRDVNTGKLTGVAFGKDCLTVGGVKRTGLFALVDDETVFELDPITKKYKFKGEITADAGKIGWFKIVDGNLMGYDADGIKRIALIQNNVPQLGELYDGGSYKLGKDMFGTITGGGHPADLGPDDENVDFRYDWGIINPSDYFNMIFEMTDACNPEVGNPGNAFFTVPFTLPADGSVKFIFSDFINKESNESSSNDIYHLVNSVYINIPGGGSKRIDSDSEVLLVAGTYSLSVHLEYRMNTLKTGIYPINFGLKIKEASFRRVLTCNFIGKNGIISRFGAYKYMQFQDDKGFEVRYGNYGLRVGDSGIQKLQNGSWVSI